MKDEEGSLEQLQFFKTRVGSTQEQRRDLRKNLLTSAQNPLVPIFKSYLCYLLDFGRTASSVPKCCSVTVGDASATVLAIVSRSTSSVRGAMGDDTDESLARSSNEGDFKPE